LALAGGEAHAKAVIQFLRSAPQVFDPAPLTLIALSNLTTSTAGAKAGFSAGPFLAAAWGAGLDIAMLDALDRDLAGVADLCRVFAGERVFAPGEFTDKSGDKNAAGSEINSVRHHPHRQPRTP
jgi:hypothetical protein